MALTIEDGTGKADATSYVTAAEARAYAAARGVTLDANDAVVEPLLVQAMDYLEALIYKGHRTFPDVQALSWPRTCVVIDGVKVPVSGASSIPRQLKAAQMQLSIEASNGIDLMPTTDGRVVKREKVDVIETEYMTNTDLGVGGLPGPSFAKVDALLAGLLATGGMFQTVRV